MPSAVLLLSLRLLAAFALYAFMGAAFYLLWRDLQASSRQHKLTPPAFLVRMIGDTVEHVFRLQDVNLIGRAAGISVSLGDETVSGHHARISFQGGQWWLEDLGSRNGTTLNGLAIEAPLVVTYGDRIQLGSVEVLLVQEDPTQGESTAAGSVV